MFFFFIESLHWDAMIMPGKLLPSSAIRNLAIGGCHKTSIANVTARVVVNDSGVYLPVSNLP